MTNPAILTNRDGEQVFTDGSPSERLAAALRGYADTDRDAERRAAVAARKAEADRDPAWAAATDLACKAEADAAELVALAGREFQTRKPDPFAEWEQEQTDRWAGRLLKDDVTMRATLDDVRERWRVAAIEMPATNAELQALGIRLQRLDNATPSGALELVQDAIQRDDAAFLAAASLDVQAWKEVRNSWRSKDARETVARVTDLLDVATWTADKAVAGHVNQRADATQRAWQYLAAQLTAGRPAAVLDAAHQQVGALSPLLDPGPDA